MKIIILIATFAIGLQYGEKIGRANTYNGISEYLFEAKIVKRDIKTGNKYLADSTKLSNYLWREINLR